MVFLNRYLLNFVPPPTTATSGHGFREGVLIRRWRLKRMNFFVLLLTAALLWAVHPTSVLGGEPFRINVIDSGSGWPVPLVELKTVHHIRFVSDNAGVIAIDLPELIGVETWFSVEGHGYEIPVDGFGFRGLRATPVSGGELTLRVDRTLPGKRLGRLTGGGLFAESQRLGLYSEWRDQGILGCDSVQTAVHRGKLYWAWGDTQVARYPLGLFHMISGTTAIQPLQSFEPPLQLRYDYFVDQGGQPRVVAQMPGDGPTWLSGYVSLPDETGKQRLVGTYVKVQPPLTVYETGLCIWDDQSQRFQKDQVLWTKSEQSSQSFSSTPPPCPDGHPLFWDDESGKRWVLFGDPFPRLRCEATFEAWRNPSSWKTLEPQSSVPTVAGNEEIVPHRGSIAWNAYRKKWVAIFTQLHGKSSELGEIWYAESDLPTGRWQRAVHVVTHRNYTFYNPRLHPEFTPSASPILLFEGTYTKEFANHAEATPRFDYNQVLYRLDLDGAEFQPK